MRIRYAAHNGVRRNAYVIMPRWYRRGNAPALPLVISPHGRGLTGLANLRFWGDLPARGRFAVISPEGHGRVLPLHSWGWEGQIRDLANKMWNASRLILLNAAEVRPGRRTYVVLTLVQPYPDDSAP